MITIKPIATFYDDDDKAVIARKVELAETGQRRQSELAAIDAAIAKQGNIAPTPDTQIQNLIDGNAFVPPQPLSARRTELQETIRDIEQGLDYLAGKERQVNISAGQRLAKDIKPQHDNAAKELAAAMVVVHEKHLVYWQAKRHLINNGIGLHGLFNSSIDDVLGVPVDNGTPLADYLRAEARAGYLKNVPASVR